jgi:hypothetical protein
MAARDTQPTDGFPAFWEKFRSAVISRDKKAVAALSRFPIGMSNEVPAISNSRDLSRRFAEVFDQDANAAACFARTEPTADTESRDRYAISCQSNADNFVAYEFERTPQGWRFVHRQFPTKCGCR